MAGLRHPKFVLFLALSIVIIFSIIPGTTEAQASPPHVIIGQVINSNGEPIGSGRVSAWIDLNSDSVVEQIHSAEIDQQGKFTMLVELGQGYAGRPVIFQVDGAATTYEVSDSKAQTAKTEVKLEIGGGDPVKVTVLPAPEPAPVPANVLPAAPSTPVPAVVAVAPPPTMAPREPGFRENPTTRLRPVNEQITADQAGIVEIFMVIPSVNDVPLTVDMVITVPSGIHVYGEGFSCAGSGAGACNGSFTILPGQSKSGHLNVKAEKIGSYQVHFSGFWWPGNNKDLRQPISLTHPFNVLEPSKDLTPPGSVASTVAQNPTQPPPAPSKNTETIVVDTGGCMAPVNEGSGRIPLGTLALGMGIVGLCVRRFV